MHHIQADRKRRLFTLNAPYDGHFCILEHVKVGQQNKSSLNTLANPIEEHENWVSIFGFKVGSL